LISPIFYFKKMCRDFLWLCLHLIKLCIVLGSLKFFMLTMVWEFIYRGADLFFMGLPKEYTIMTKESYEKQPWQNANEASKILINSHIFFIFSAKYRLKCLKFIIVLNYKGVVRKLSHAKNYSSRPPSKNFHIGLSQINQFPSPWRNLWTTSNTISFLQGSVNIVKLQFFTIF